MGKGINRAVSKRKGPRMSTPVATPLVLDLGAPEIVLILLVLVLLFGAKKLPDLARGSGRALRIFKAETKGLLDDDDDVKESEKTEAQRQLEAQRRSEAAQRLEAQGELPSEQPRPDTER
jgi:sec-independent protein translocase protein TatA